MSLEFTGSDADRVNHGSATSLDNVASWSFVVWLTCDNYAASERVFTKGYQLAELGWQGDGRFGIGHSGTSGNDWAETAASYVPTGSWVYLAGTHESAGAANRCKIYKGSLTSPATIATPDYVENTAVGTSDNSALDFIVGNERQATFNQSWDGLIALLGFWNTVLTAEQLIQQQFSLVPLVATTNCVLFTNYGYHGVSTQPDWSGNVNNGTITGATRSDHVPLGIPFQVPMYWQLPAGPTLSIAVTPTDASYWKQGVRIVG